MKAGSWVGWGWKESRCAAAGGLRPVRLLCSFCGFERNSPFQVCHWLLDTQVMVAAMLPPTIYGVLGGLAELVHNAGSWDVLFLQLDWHGHIILS